MSQVLDSCIEPRPHFMERSPAAPFPSLQEAAKYLSGFEQEGGGNWREENERYLFAHTRRFYETLKAIPRGNPGQSLLELGATPYFMTLLLERYSDYQLHLANGYRVGDPDQMSIKLIRHENYEERSFDFKTFNVEIDSFPYPDKSFDVVLCCELIEHLALDPTHMLLEIHRILKPGGRLLITTPNVLVLRNLVTLLKYQRNIYYPYSGYGVYGRHNREWTLGELVELLGGCGYVVEKAEIVDTYPHRGYSKWLKRYFPFLRDMLLVRGSAVEESRRFYPESLFESLPRQYLPENPIPTRLQNQLQQNSNSDREGGL